MGSPSALAADPQLPEYASPNWQVLVGAKRTFTYFRVAETLSAHSRRQGTSTSVEGTSTSD